MVGFKRGMAFYEVFIYLIAIITVGLIIFFGLKSFMMLKGGAEDSRYVEFKNSLQADVNVVKKKYGFREDKNYIVPSEVAKIIFVDLSRKEPLLRSIIMKNYSLINDSLGSDVQKNVFIYSKKGVMIDSFYVGNIESGILDSSEQCEGLDYVIPVNGRIKITMTGKGGKALLGRQCPINCEQISTCNKFIGTPRKPNGAILSGLKCENDVLKTITYPDGTVNNIGVYTSPVIDLGSNRKFELISWKSNRAIVKFQLGTSVDGSNPTGFIGPDGNDPISFYTLTGYKINPSHDGSRYIQYKVELEASDPGTYTPELSEVVICYYDDNAIIADEDKCRNAANGGLCNYLDNRLGVGYKDKCCSDFQLCC